LLALGLHQGGIAEKLPLAYLATIGLLALRPTRRASTQEALRMALERVRRFALAPRQAPIPWPEAVLGVALPFLAIDLAHGKLLGAIDTRPVIPTALSLVSQGDWSVSEFRGGRDPRHRVLESPSGTLLLCFQEVGGQVYSSYPQGMVPFALGPAALARGLGLPLDDVFVYHRLEKLTAAAVAAAVLALFFLNACCLGSVGSAAFVTVLLASGSALLTSVGLGLWQHGGVAFWLLLALLVELRSAGSPGWIATLLQGIVLAQMLACRPTAGLIVGLFGIWVLARSPRRGLLLGLATALGFLPWLALNLQLYHNALGPFAIHSRTSGQFWHFFDGPRMLGVLISPARGLFIYQPWAILALGLAIPALRRSTHYDTLSTAPRGWSVFCAVAATSHAFVISAWNEWAGGFCWGSRLLSEIVPLLGLLAVPVVTVLHRCSAGRVLLLALLLISPLTHLPCIVANADAWDFVTDHDADLWSWTNAPFFYRGR
jgi:hypothetical protein